MTNTMTDKAMAACEQANTFAQLHPAAQVALIVMAGLVIITLLRSM